jgi:hypothetical protein
MKQLILGAALVGTDTAIGALSSDNINGTANAQFAPPSGQPGDALWHLPRFGEQGWFLHANNGRVRACNMDKVSVVGDKTSPNGHQCMAKVVQSHTPSPSPKHETASSRNSIKKWYIIWGLDKLNYLPSCRGNSPVIV